MLDRTAMNRQKVLACSFAAAILAAHCHCLVEHAREVRAAMPCPSVAAAPASPVMPGCENESGCICNGATLVVAVDAPPADATSLDLADQLAAVAWGIGLTDATRTVINSPLERAPCLSAQKMRALLQTYRI
jgi:hypothetical protein